MKVGLKNRLASMFMLTTVVVGAGVLVAAGAASAHHSTAMFDKSKKISVQGTVKEFQYTNPHSWLMVDVMDASGKTTLWGFEAEGPAAMRRDGIARNTLVPGEKITLTMNPMKDGRPGGALLDFTKADGKFISLRPVGVLIEPKN